MTINWGSWEDSGGNGMRVGIDTTVPSVGHGASDVTFTYKIYTENRYSYSDDQVLTYTGNAGGGSTAFNKGSSGGAQLRATRTYTYTYGGSEYGSSPGSRTFIATISGAFNGVTPSKTVTVTIPARPYAAPAAPAALAGVRISDSRIDLNWNRNSTAGAPYTSQTLQRRTFAGSAWSDWVTVATPSGSADTFTNNGLSANRIYQFRIRANNSAGSSAFANSSTIPMTPAAPSAVKASLTSTGTGIKITWTDNAYNPSPPETFLIQRSVAGGAYANLAGATALTGTTFTDNSPGVGTNQYRVRCDFSGLSSAFATSNVVTTVTVPLAPTKLSPNGVYLDLAGAGVTLKWQHNPGTDGADQSHYTVELSNNGGSTWTAYVATNIASRVEQRVIPAGVLVNGVTYLWRVRTQGATTATFGPNSASATLLSSTKPTVALISPTDPVTALPVPVEWTFSQAEGLAQAEWELELVDVNGNVVESQAGTTETTTTLATNVNGESDPYTLRVRAMSATAGVWSNWASVTFTVVLVPPAATHLTATYDPCTGTMILEMCAEAAVPPTTVDVESVTIERRIEDGEWVTIATGVPVPICPAVNEVLDVLPATDGTNTYRVTSVSSSPSYYLNPEVVVETTSGDPNGTGGMWVFMAYGDSFQNVLRMRGDLSLSARTSRVRETQHFLGRGFPALLVGTNKDRVVSASGTIHWTDAWCPPGEVPGDCHWDSPADDWETMGLEAEIVCYRDYTGRRVFGRLADVQVSDGIVGFAEVSFEVTEVKYDEVTGTWPSGSPSPSLVP
jgi:hypothetical protein